MNMKADFGIHELEANYNDLLPAEVAHLYSYYDVHERGFIWEYLKMDKELVLITCYRYCSNQYENFISGLLSPESLEEEIRAFKDKTEEYHVRGYIKIGYWDKDDLLLLSINNDSKGEVSVLKVSPTGDYKNIILRLNKNILEFLNHLELTLIEPNLRSEGINANDICKKWGQQYWELNKYEI